MEESTLGNSTEDEETRGNPKNQYFTWGNLLCIAFSISISAYFIFELQINAFLLNLVISYPEETEGYLIYLKSCKIPRFKEISNDSQSKFQNVGFQNNEIGQDFKTILDLTCNSTVAANETADFSKNLNPTVMEKITYWNSILGTNNQESLPYSVAVIVIGSTSKVNTFKSLPQTINLLESESRFVSMNGYHAMVNHSNTKSRGWFPESLLPLLNGIPIEIDSNTNVAWNDYFMLWSKFERMKFITMLIDDKPLKINRESGRERKPTTDYYFNPFSNTPFKKHRGKALCIDNKTSTSYLLHNLQKLHKEFESVPLFSFSYLSWPQSLGQEKFLSKMDETYSDFFKALLEIQTVSSRTAIVVISDYHGSSYFNSTDHYDDTFEKLNPLLMIRLPDELTRKRPKFITNLNVNKHRLVSPLDIHRTITFFSKLALRNKRMKSPKGLQENWISFGKNLFTTQISESRTCLDALISESSCLCNRLENK